MKEDEEDEDETQTIHKKSPRVIPEEPSNKDAPATENTKPIEKSPSDKSLQGGISPRPKMELKLTSPASTDASAAATGAAAEPPTPQTPAEIREKIMYNKDGTSTISTFFNLFLFMKWNSVRPSENKLSFLYTKFGNRS